MYTIDFSNYPDLAHNFEKTIDVDPADVRFMPMDELMLLTNEYLFPYRGWINPNALSTINFKSEADKTFFLLKFS
jgi:hypothetical protein